MRLIREIGTETKKKDTSKGKQIGRGDQWINMTETKDKRQKSEKTKDIKQTRDR